jgi:hypothetical protein
MKILSFVKDMDGSSYHRIHQPNSILDAEVRTVNNLKEEDISWCDILIYSRHTKYSPNFLSALRVKYGFKIIVDTDDWWEVQKDHPLYTWWSQSNVSLQIRNHMMNADAVICTHGNLAEIVPNKNVYVIPNGLNYDSGQFCSRPTGKGLLYASTVMNWSNTTLLSGTARKLQDLDVSYVIAGYHDSPFYPKLINNLTSGIIPYKTKPWTGVEQYMGTYEGHIGVLPSKPTQFNMLKSNLKVLEFGALGMPAVVSRCEPYLGMPVDYFSGENEFCENVRKLHLDKKYREKKGDELHEFSREYYHIKNFSELRMLVYELIQRGNSNDRKADPSEDGGQHSPAAKKGGLPDSDLRRRSD